MGIKPSVEIPGEDSGAILGNDQVGQVYANIRIVAQNITDIVFVSDNYAGIVNAGTTALAAQTAAEAARDLALSHRNAAQTAQGTASAAATAASSSETNAAASATLATTKATAADASATAANLAKLAAEAARDQAQVTQTELDTGLASKADVGHVHAFSSLTSKPTTLVGYGITDALPLIGGTLTGKLTVPNSTAGAAGLNVGYGVNPSAPVNGDLWVTTSNALRFYAGATTFTLATTGTLASYQLTSEKGAANGYASLGADAKILTSQLSALAITEVYAVASQAAQLALVADEGDVAIRSDLNKSFIHNGGVAGTMADWSELLSPTAAVLSVAGRTGAVVLVKADVGLSNVDNTSDANKPVSTAQQTALNLKLDKTGGTVGNLFGESFVGNGHLVSRGSVSEGGQLVLGYGGGAATTITGQANSTWNIDVDPANALRILKQNAAGVATIPLKIAEFDGSITLTGPTMFINTDKLLVQHDGSHGFIRAQTGNLNLGANAATTFSLFAASALMTVPFTVTGIISNKINLSGHAELVPGNASNTGYVAFHDAAGTRAGYVGFADTTKVDMVAEGGRHFNANAFKIADRVAFRHGSTAFGSGEIHMSTAAPSGGADGDIWLQYV